MNKKLSRYLMPVIIIAVIITVSAAAFMKAAYVVPVLMYHSIEKDITKKSRLDVSPESFARQMEFLYKHHYNVVGLEKIIEYIEKKERIPAKTVAITFDDGFYNNYEHAYPVLKKYRLPATIFIITERIGKPGWLGWHELKEMSDSGIISIGSHTVIHKWLPTLDKEALKKELSGSKITLEEGLGKKVNLLCYPMGGVNEDVEKAARDAGYAGAVGTHPRRFKPNDDPYAIKRLRISDTSDNILVFWAETSGYYTWIKEHRDKH